MEEVGGPAQQLVEVLRNDDVLAPGQGQRVVPSPVGRQQVVPSPVGLQRIPTVVGPHLQVPGPRSPNQQRLPQPSHLYQQRIPTVVGPQLLVVPRGE